MALLLETLIIPVMTWKMRWTVTMVTEGKDAEERDQKWKTMHSNEAGERLRHAYYLTEENLMYCLRSSKFRRAILAEDVNNSNCSSSRHGQVTYAELRMGKDRARAEEKPV